jgi:hypothetical protein
MSIAELHQEARFEKPDSRPRYDLSPGDAHRLCHDFLVSAEHKPQNQFGCYAIEGFNNYSNLGRFVESSVFLDAFGNTPEIMAQEYGPYENASEFLVVMDHDTEMPVGVLRTIKDSDAGLKSLNDLKDTPLQLDAGKVCEELKIVPDRCIDVGTLAIQPEFRARVGNILPSLLLYRSLYVRYLNNPDYDHVVTIIDKDAEKNLNRLSFPFKPIDERYFSYLDSKQSRALYGINKAFYASVEQRKQELLDEAEKEGVSSSKMWMATALDGLANGTHLDEMLAFGVPAASNH